MSSFEERIKDFLSSAYDIERELGGGGMSRVFVATDRLLGRKVVIKLLSPELTAEVNRGRFRREIQVAAQLQHPHIVTLLSAGEDGELVYYTMPFIEGESLKSALEKHGKLPVADVIRVLYDVVDALSYAHQHGVVHRDIKPANILRSGNHALVTDFGVAKALNAAMPSSAMTSTGMAIGTPAYMAPEQLAGDPTADHRIDIYALGLLAYELLSGQSPFAATTAQGVLAAVLTRDPKPLYEVRKEVPRKLSAIIMSCLSKIPGGRPPSAEAMLDALDMIATASGEIRTREHKVPLSQRSTPVLPVPAVIAVPEPVVARDPTAPVPVEKKSRNKFAMAAAALVLIAGTAGGAAYLSKRNNDTTPVAGAEQSKAAPTVATVTPTVLTAADSDAIAESVKKRLAQAQAEAANFKGQPAINVDSIRKKVQHELADSIAKANAKKAAAAQLAAQPVPPSVTANSVASNSVPAASTPAAAAVAPAPAPAPAPVPEPPRSGKKRLAITDPKPSDQAALNSFSRALIDALRVSLDNGDEFDVVAQDEVRDALARGGSRDGAAKILKPDVMVSPGYVTSGDATTIIVTVWDLRSSSSFGIRVTSTKLDATHPDQYLGPIVQSVMKQLSDLSRTPTIYRRQ